MIKCVSFDLWNTLIHNIHYTERRIAILNSYFQQDDFLISNDQLREIYDNEIVKHHISIQLNSYEHVYTRQILQEMYDACKQPFPPMYLDSLITEWENLMLRNPPALKDGVIEILPILAQKYKIALISDTGICPGQIIRKMFEHHDILQYFDVLVFSDEIGIKKPHSKPFQEIINKTRYEPHEIVHIGDLLHTDILGGNRMGFQTVWFNDLYVDGKKQQEILLKYPELDPLLLKPTKIATSHSDLINIIETL